VPTSTCRCVHAISRPHGGLCFHILSILAPIAYSCCYRLSECRCRRVAGPTFAWPGSPLASPHGASPPSLPLPLPPTRLTISHTPVANLHTSLVLPMQACHVPRSEAPVAVVEAWVSGGGLRGDGPSVNGGGLSAQTFARVLEANGVNAGTRQQQV
jgi:hypothetical protein